MVIESVRRIGFVGLGVMGRPMALNLVTAGFELTVFDLNAGAIAGVEKAGAARAAGLPGLARSAEVVITMLPDTADVERVIFGEGGLVEGLSTGQVVIDMSSISPPATRDFAVRLEEQGVALLDAPVSGGRAGAEQGVLSIMVGGPEEVFERCRPVLAAMGRTIVHLGPSGSGQTAKACNQLLIANTLLGIAEAMVLAEKSGLHLAQLRDVLMGGAAGSRLLDIVGARMLERRFTDGFRSTLHLKDLRAAFAAADDLGVALPGTALSAQLIGILRNTGRGDLDHSALIDVIRELSGAPVPDDQ